MSSATPPTENLSLAEVDAILRAMSPADWARALSLARLRAAGLPGWTGESLLAEALVKLQAGERVWRRGVPPLVTLKVLMHSIASNLRKKEAGAPIDRFATVDVGAGDESDDGEPQAVSAVDTRTPEQVLDARSQLVAIEKLVEGDEDAQLVLLAWSEGLRGRQAADDLGFDMKRYDAARQRLLRLLKPAASLRDTK